MTKLIAGTRGSSLARKQTQRVVESLQKVWPDLKIEIRVIKTRGDRLQNIPLVQIGGKGLFTKELENSLINREIDFAVHSLKDLPIEQPTGVTIGAYLPRDRPNDVLVSKGKLSLDAIPRHGIIATGSLRRKFQLRHYRRDLCIVDIRGNIETRLRKLQESDWHGLILAYAALKRLEKIDLIGEVIPQKMMYPAVGQGTVAVECRDEIAMRGMFSRINHHESALCARAERAFLKGVGGGCQIPLGVISTVQGEQLTLSGVYMPKEDRIVQDCAVGTTSFPEGVGQDLARKISGKVKLG
ncbi:hydroxymethylbilane synthase [candidate division KSB3 bacterium]|uniref:Porphobilinogen deaminase n=1 Tax=candidate division KSB3 bacterium TaxID=2044937 RepID=A0A2G6E423_9BACT|nr:MAG: hydroxymethylbilane synthase [candidate division KSB3 bacterium]PIE29322.1 MAG: hydroxymethylbilane synthase [candidate division KSB3 bacterium]